MANLPLSTKLAERAERLLEWHVGIRVVELVQVDALESQPFETSLQRLAKVLRAAVGPGGLLERDLPSFRGDHEIVGIGVKSSGNQPFALLTAVHVSGVDQVHAQLERPSQELRASLEPGQRDPHGAEAHPVHRQVASERDRAVCGGRLVVGRDHPPSLMVFLRTPAARCMRAPAGRGL